MGSRSRSQGYTFKFYHYIYHCRVGFLTVEKVFLTDNVKNLSKTCRNIVKNLLNTRVFDMIVDMFLTPKKGFKFLVYCKIWRWYQCSPLCSMVSNCQLVIKNSLPIRHLGDQAWKSGPCIPYLFKYIPREVIFSTYHAPRDQLEAGISSNNIKQ